jgi:hypothetical protein
MVERWVPPRLSMGQLLQWRLEQYQQPEANEVAFKTLTT